MKKEWLKQLKKGFILIPDLRSDLIKRKTQNHTFVKEKENVLESVTWHTIQGYETQEEKKVTKQEKTEVKAQKMNQKFRYSVFSTKDRERRINSQRFPWLTKVGHNREATHKSRDSLCVCVFLYLLHSEDRCTFF